MRDAQTGQQIILLQKKIRVAAQILGYQRIIQHPDFSLFTHNLTCPSKIRLARPLSSTLWRAKNKHRLSSPLTSSRLRLPSAGCCNWCTCNSPPRPAENPPVKSTGQLRANSDSLKSCSGYSTLTRPSAAYSA